MAEVKPHEQEMHKVTKTWGTASWHTQLTSARRCTTILSSLLEVEIFEKDCYVYDLRLPLSKIFLIGGK